MSAHAESFDCFGGACAVVVSGVGSRGTAADAAHVILLRDKSFSGHFCIDDEVLASAGVTNLDHYAMTDGADLLPDFFV